MAENKVTTAQSTPASIDECNITSNSTGQSVSLLGGIINLTYYESLLQDTLMASVTFADAGDSIDGKSVSEGLPLENEEKVEIKIKDNNDVSLDLKFFVNDNKKVGDETTKSLLVLDLVSQEFIVNNKVRVSKRYDGQPSDTVTELLTDSLATEKDIDIEETSEPRNCFGGNRKPIYLINWLSQQSVPKTQDAKGKTAGYFFYETSEGFKYKSIDSLFNQEKKKSIIYNETPDSRGANIPEGYDIKALSMQKENRNNVTEKEEMGAYATRLISFNPFNCQYDVATFSAEAFEGSYSLGGAALPKGNPELKQEGFNKNYTRTTYQIKDIGTMPSGSTEQQIEKSKEENFKVSEICNQAIMRYNQMFLSKIKVTIPGDFSLHAGDAVFFDAPSPQRDVKNDEVDRQIGGLYIIAALCHYITRKETYTNLVLVRDSFGRTGKASTSPSSTSQSGTPAKPIKAPGVQSSAERRN